MARSCPLARHRRLAQRESQRSIASYPSLLTQGVRFSDRYPRGHETSQEIQPHPPVGGSGLRYLRERGPEPASSPIDSLEPGLPPRAAAAPGPRVGFALPATHYMQNVPNGGRWRGRGTLCMSHVHGVPRPAPAGSNGRFCRSQTRGARPGFSGANGSRRSDGRGGQTVEAVRPSAPAPRPSAPAPEPARAGPPPEHAPLG
jgi:hypothetical protein